MWPRVGEKQEREAVIPPQPRDRALQQPPRSTPPVSKDRQTHTGIDTICRHVCEPTVRSLPHSITDKCSRRHTPICHCTKVIRTHLGACHSVSEVRAFTFCWSVCLRFSTFSCFVFFSNILISSGRFARREAKYTSCIFRTANTDGDRVTVFHRWPRWTHCCVCVRITRTSLLVFVEDKYDRSLCLRPLLF